MPTRRSLSAASRRNPQQVLAACLIAFAALAHWGEPLAQSPVPKVPAKVYIRASGDWAAKTTADANIYVALGTLLRLDDEDEVAALLAHEAAHVILGHANADVVQDVQQRAIQVSALALDTRDFVRGVANGTIVIIDASNLERSIYLATQIRELDCKALFALNMADLAQARGMKIDARKLSELLE